MKEPQELTHGAITDAKSLYDNLNREQYTKAEKRAALEVCVIKDSLDSMDGAVFWFPHDRNPTDCLTKLKGNTQQLLHLMKTARFKLTDVDKDMEGRKEYRIATGRRNPRPNVSTTTDIAADDPTTTVAPLLPPTENRKNYI